ncbi:MAG TPA: response regulator [Planctomycetes bacterium]|nr:response regulator [Planctomycetaceae bacterium]HIM31857.1 response regulator [Planctomycetota bacterium]
MGNEAIMHYGQTIGRPLEILLVEDSLLDAHTAIAALRDGEINHRLTLVRDGEEALNFLHRVGCFSRAPRPDIILLDLHLPKRDGLSVLKEVKADFSLNEIPVVVLSASDNDADQSACDDLAVESFIRKPVNFDKFVAVIRQLKQRYFLADIVLPT